MSGAGAATVEQLSQHLLGRAQHFLAGNSRVGLDLGLNRVVCTQSLCALCSRWRGIGVAEERPWAHHIDNEDHLGISDHHSRRAHRLGALGKLPALPGA